MKENRKKVIMYTTLGIIALGIVALTVTYAYWRLTKEQTKKNVIQTGCFSINFTGENDITLNKAYPMKPEELENFLSTETPYHFTIENTCDNLATATINLESLNAGSEKQLNDEYIDAILYETDYHNNLNSEKQLNESMYNDENKVISNSLHAYELYNFVLQKGETKSFNLLLYMDSNTPMETANMNATWKGKITLSAGYKEEKVSIPTIELGNDIQPVENGDGLYAVSHDVSEISTNWNQTEYRYAGANVNNYVSFNNEIWRVIGKVNVQTDNGVEQRLKIVRTEVEGQKGFGNHAWNKTTKNDWTISTLKDMLNGIYYESSSGDCYMGDSGDTAEQLTCDFTGEGIMPKGLNSISQNMIDKDILWNIGGYSDNEITIDQFYEKERGNIYGNNYYSTHPVEWSNETDIGGKHNGIGLIYPSDYGYATSGGKACFEVNINETDTNCGTNNWLKPKNNYMWFLTTDTHRGYDTFIIGSEGHIYMEENVDFAYEIWPTLYLKSSVKITSNPHLEQDYGSIDNPFQLIDTSL